MAGLSPEVLAERYPVLWHMAEAGAWPSIERHGLLSTTALLDLFEVQGEQRIRLESCRRPDSETISHPSHGTAVIRDNKPLIEKVLARTLDDMTPREFYEALNRRVFFWVSKSRLDRLRSAPLYRKRQHLILKLDTAALLERHLNRVTLSPLNSGATHPGAVVRRGRETFRALGDYPWEQRLRTHRREPVVELAVDYAVPDAAELVISRQHQ